MATTMRECSRCGGAYPENEIHTCPALQSATPSIIEVDNWQHRAENMRCQTCMWYVPKNEKIGRCRYNAPTIKGWPAMFPTDWCGQHKIDENKV